MRRNPASIKPNPPKRRIPLPKKPPKVIEPDTVYKRRPKHPKRDKPNT